MRLFPVIMLTVGMVSLITVPQTTLADPASERTEINRNVNEALAQLYKTVPGSQAVAKQARGVLVFPAIYKAGFVIGGEYGKGALRVHGKTVGYYSTVAASFGFQAGADKRSMALMFMTPEALQRFQHSNGWDVGGDASVTLVEVGANGAVDVSRLNKPVVAFFYGNTGLMGGVSLKGTKVSKLDLGPSTASGTSVPK